MKSIAIICVGDELLDGRVRDENAHHLLQVSRRNQLRIAEIRIVGDERQKIADALGDLGDGVDLVVVSGGLGPTGDDVTRDAAADFCDCPLVEDADLVEKLRTRFKERGYRFTENNRQQCRFPEKAEILPTEVGTAAGFRLEHQGTAFYFFPGVPHEFRWFAGQYLPQPKATSSLSSKTLTFFGRGESSLETDLGNIPARAQNRGVHLGFRAAFPVIEIVVEGKDRDVAHFEDQILSAVGRWLIAEEDQTLAGRLGKRLVEAEATVSVAESCTAGLLGAHLTAASGSSAYFEEGYLTYSNEAKTRLVDVDESLLESFGAVSAPVVAQMAAGARERSDATFALSISGIAGPTGGSEEKPVGTVDFALAGPEGVYVRRSHFPGRSREQVRELSAHVAMALLLWHLEDRLDEHRLRGPFSYADVAKGVATNDA